MIRNSPRRPSRGTTRLTFSDSGDKKHCPSGFIGVPGIVPVDDDDDDDSTAPSAPAPPGGSS